MMYVEIMSVLHRLRVQDRPNGIVQHEAATCLCGGKIVGGVGRREHVIERVSSWVALHIGEGHRVASVPTG
jgi:hypothetical protein